MIFPFQLALSFGSAFGVQASQVPPHFCDDGVLTTTVDFGVCVRPQPYVPAPVYPSVVISPDGHVLTRGPVTL